MPDDTSLLNRVTRLERKIKDGLTLARLTVRGALTGAAATFTSLTVGGVAFPVSGTYTPTLTNTTNIATSTAFACQYLRVGNVVHVAGRVDIDATLAGATSTVLDMTLPIASDIASSINLGGVGSNASGASGEIRGDATGILARFTYPSGTTANSSFFFTFTYLVI